MAPGRARVIWRRGCQSPDAGEPTPGHHLAPFCRCRSGRPRTTN